MKHPITCRCADCLAIKERILKAVLKTKRKPAKKKRLPKP